MNRIQSKDHYMGSCRINKISLSCYNDENIYFKMAIVDCCIFINLFNNHTKIASSNIKHLFSSSV